LSVTRDMSAKSARLGPLFRMVAGGGFELPIPLGCTFGR